MTITVFERNSYIGGRSTTVDAYDDPKYPVELGASIFVEINHILFNATKEFNLSTNAFISQSDIPGAGLAVWNGEEFVITQSGGSGWWDIAKLFWRYGLGPMKTMRLVKEVVGKFLEMYDEPAFPFQSLTQVGQDVGLLAVTAATGTQYLEENGITGDFGQEIVQASTRVNYAQNLDYIHGLEAMVSMAAENAQAVAGGNWQIFASMIQASQAIALLGTSVIAIDKTKHGRYQLRFSDAGTASSADPGSQTFDDVVLATPYQYSNISLPEELTAPDTIPYVQLHVTLFTSPHLLSPSFFGQKPNNPAPRVVLTTLPKREEPASGPEGVGSPGFFSISLLRQVTNPKSSRPEYLYKIFSATPPNSTFLHNLLGVAHEDVDEVDAESKNRPITWCYRKVWNSYPYEFPRVTFERIEMGKNLWYTGAMDSFISTMETNALMGKNVARLIVDRWLDDNHGTDGQT